MWITDYRRRHGLSIPDLAAEVYKLSLSRPSHHAVHAETIIARLEQGDVTHPRIADLIAKACHAKPWQRDLIVPAQYRSTTPPPEPDPPAPEWTPHEDEKAKQKRQDRHDFHPGRGHRIRVVAVNRDGMIIATYADCAAAASACKVSRYYVQTRCTAQRRPEKEFSLTPYTFRYEADTKGGWIKNARSIGQGARRDGKGK